MEEEVGFAGQTSGVQNKMQKTGILCNAILVIFLANMAVSMVIKPEGKTVICVYTL